MIQEYRPDVQQRTQGQSYEYSLVAAIFHTVSLGTYLHTKLGSNTNLSQVGGLDEANAITRTPQCTRLQPDLDICLDRDGVLHDGSNVSLHR